MVPGEGVPCVWGICRPHVAVLDCSDGSHNGGFGIPFWEACKCAAVARDLGDEGRCRIYRVGERGQRTQVCCHPVVLGVHLQLKRLLLTPIETVVRCLFPVSKDKMAT